MQDLMEKAKSMHKGTPGIFEYIKRKMGSAFSGTAGEATPAQWQEWIQGQLQE
jgi:hypothetical protein